MNIVFMARLRTLVYLALASISLGFVSSCDKTPIEPTDETQNKLHENPHKLIYTLTEYSLPEGKQFNYKDLASFTPSTKVQKLVLGIQADKTFAFEGDKEFVVKTMADSPSVIYKLTIEHFNPQGQPMNEQFLKNGQDNIHQYIFSIFHDGLTVREEEQIPYLYLYADKDVSGKYIGESNPVGIEGFFQFKAGLELQVVKATLLHAYSSKYYEGKPSSYFIQNPKITGAKDISVDLTFRHAGDN